MAMVALLLAQTAEVVPFATPADVVLLLAQPRMIGRSHYARTAPAMKDILIWVLQTYTGLQNKPAMPAPAWKTTKLSWKNHAPAF